MQQVLTCAQCFVSNEDVHAYNCPGFERPLTLCPQHVPAKAELTDDGAAPDFGRVLGAFRTGHICSQCQQIGKIAFYETVLGIAYHIIEQHQEP